MNETQDVAFAPCTIRTNTGKEYSGIECVGSGLGYYTENTQSPCTYFLTHIPSGLSIASGMCVTDEKAVQDALREITRAHLVDWTLPQDALYSEIGSTREHVIKTLRDITHRYEEADQQIHGCTYTLSFIVRGTIHVLAYSDKEAEVVARDALEMLDMKENDEVENFFLDDIEVF